MYGGVSTPAVLIIAYNRPLTLEKLFKSLENSWNYDLNSFVIVHQSGDKMTAKVIDGFLSRNSNSILIQVNGSQRSSTENISFNRHLGLKFCFETLSTEYVVALEDDVEVSIDIFNFTKFIMQKYSKNRNFRGINYGSFEPHGDQSSLYYSKVRFGVHGPVSTITKMTWKSLNVPRVREKLTRLLYDGVFEYFCKTGFMITPENSRFLDIGYNGTHTPGLSDPYFHKMASSFVGGGEIAENATYKFRKINHSWREDAVVYNRIDNWKYYLIWFCNSRNRYYVFTKLERALYRLLILKRVRKLN